MGIRSKQYCSSNCFPPRNSIEDSRDSLMKLSEIQRANLKAIATDLDGTALNAKHVFDQELMHVLMKLKRKINHVILSTGRHKNDVQGLTIDFPQQLTLVTSNGAMLDFAAPAQEQRVFLNPSVVQYLLDQEYSDELILNAYTSNGWYVNRTNSELTDFFSTEYFSFKFFADGGFDQNDVIKFFVVDTSIPPKAGYNSEVLKKLYASFKKNFGDSVALTFSQVNCLEINANNINKANTVNKYLNAVGLDIESNLIAFGDGFNDFEMLSRAKYGFVMANADPALIKALADYPNVHVVGQNTDLMVARILNDIFELGEPLEPYFKD